VDLNGLSDPIIGLLVTLQSVEEVAYKIEQKRLCSRRIIGIKRLKAEEEEDVERNCLCLNLGLLRSIRTRTVYVSTGVNKIIVYIQEW
jgi:hypothetical protein